MHSRNATWQPKKKTVANWCRTINESRIMNSPAGRLRMKWREENEETVKNDVFKM
jgi:hypothetical protein